MCDQTEWQPHPSIYTIKKQTKNKKQTKTKQDFSIRGAFLKASFDVIKSGEFLHASITDKQSNFKYGPFSEQLLLKSQISQHFEYVELNLTTFPMVTCLSVDI